jgi:hypothetical protein
MITKPKATACKHCGDTPYKGARCKECFNRSHREQQAARRAAAAKTCRCGRPMGAQAKRCYTCIWGTSGEEHRQPRVYQKPPDEYKMKHMTKAEKKTVEVLPVLDTEAEKEKRKVLLAKAQAERMAVPVQSRWERGSLWD